MHCIGINVTFSNALKCSRETFSEKVFNARSGDAVNHTPNLLLNRKSAHLPDERHGLADLPPISRSSPIILTHFWRILFTVQNLHNGSLQQSGESETLSCGYYPPNKIEILVLKCQNFFMSLFIELACSWTTTILCQVEFLTSWIRALTHFALRQCLASRTFRWCVIHTVFLRHKSSVG